MSVNIAINQNSDTEYFLIYIYNLFNEYDDSGFKFLWHMLKWK